MRCSTAAVSSCRLKTSCAAQNESLHRLGETFVVIGVGHQLACACTSGLALPIAMLSPLLRNISTSFGMSPMVAISPRGIDRSFDSVVTTVPLLASGWVTSR